MGVRPFNVLSLCSGYGGLDLGVGLATGTAVTVCYVEREAYAAALLVARIQDEALDDAPVWSDLRTFNGKPWRGVVDCIIGGYPCQPFSIAGKQRGVDDPRHLWPDIARIIREVQPAFCFFENVRQHINVGLDAVWSDLRAMDYRVEGGIFSAAEVGAPHRRERLFLLAHATGARCGQGQDPRTGGGHAGNGGGGSIELERSSTALAHAPGCGRHERINGCDTWADHTGGLQESRHAGRSGSHALFPPGPTDFNEWAAILGEYPDLAPATQSPIRGVANGPAPNMAGRAEQLRLGGNGVVPLQAAYAFAVLAHRAGISLLVDVMMTRM